jgi:single-strand DNA-binding protein
MNVVVLIGRMVVDPELKYTPSGVAVCSFRIAVDRRFKSESGEKETDFIDIVTWRQSAEFAANYLGKGRLVAVHGRIQTRSWVQQDGQKRYKTEIVADSIQGLDRAKEGQPREAAPMAGAEYSAATPAAENSESDMDYDPFAEE